MPRMGQDETLIGYINQVFIKARIFKRGFMA